MIRRPKTARNDHNSRLSAIGKRYDVVIVGGGIYGATLVWEAASRGLSAILLEKHDFGSGTSANSLKTIHGGLRCLQNFDLLGVREYMRERRALTRIVPHLITPLVCVMPTYRMLSKSKSVLRAGLALYDLLTCDRNSGLDLARRFPRGQIISLPDLKALLPHLEDDQVTGGAQWHDAQVVNSERLVLAFVMSAKQRGAQTLNYVEAKEYIVDRQCVRGVIAEDLLSRSCFEVLGDAVIDCTGPWAIGHSLFTGVDSPKQHPRLARAVNLVVRPQIAPCAIGFKSRTRLDDKTSSRLLFVAPWRDGSIIGTWYSADTGRPETMAVTSDELAEFLAQFNGVFPSANLTLNDITLVHLGMLPLASHLEATEEFSLQKTSTLVHAHANGGPRGLFWVQGVKLTTARSLAARTIGVVSRHIHRKITASVSDRTKLYGGNIPNWSRFLKACLDRYAPRFSEQVVTRLCTNYGTNIDRIVEYTKRDSVLGEGIPGAADALRAELIWTLDHEMAFTLSDVLLRRTDLGSFGMPARETVYFCADVLAQHRQWTAQQKAANIQALIERYPSFADARTAGMPADGASAKSQVATDHD